VDVITRAALEKTEAQLAEDRRKAPHAVAATANEIEIAKAKT